MMVDITDRVAQLERTVYGEKWEGGRVGLEKQVKGLEESGSPSFQHFLKVGSWIFGVTMLIALVLLGFAVKYNYDLVKETAFLNARLVEHMEIKK